ncbi:MAG: hypothetical protein EXR75_03265 [Myxococcales bacterium]|nr:hypothetical protein [Myxococcales bacterium]
MTQLVNATCVILNNDTVKCWGYNYFGHLGLGDLDNRGDEPGEMGNALPALLFTGHSEFELEATRLPSEIWAGPRR